MADKTLLDTIRGVIHNGNPCVKAIADGLNVSDNTVYKWAIGKEAPDDSGSDMPVKWVAPLTRVTGNYSIIEHLCRSVGGIFVKSPNVDLPGEELRTILEKQKDDAAWISLAAETMLDGQIDDDELEKLINRGDQSTIHTEQLKLIRAARKRKGRAA